MSFGTCGCDQEKLRRIVGEGITNRVEFSGDLFMLDFDVGQRGQATRAPIDQPFAAIQETVFVQSDEHFSDRFGEPSSIVNRWRSQSQEAPSRLS